VLTTHAKRLVVLALGSLAAFASAHCGAVDLGRHDLAIGGSIEAGTSDVRSSPGAGCGTRGASPCPTDLFCIWSKDAQCGELDAPGRCVDTRALDCLNTDAPICGCDGMTYRNECLATLVGASVRHDGACVP
jgi:hypothetical protein